MSKPQEINVSSERLAGWYRETLSETTRRLAILEIAYAELVADNERLREENVRLRGDSKPPK